MTVGGRLFWHTASDVTDLDWQKMARCGTLAIVWRSVRPRPLRSHRLQSGSEHQYSTQPEYSAQAIGQDEINKDCHLSKKINKIVA